MRKTRYIDRDRIEITYTICSISVKAAYNPGNATMKKLNIRPMKKVREYEVV